ncbi:MAG: hypothetical protein LBQ12_01085 [Deltaproteobacteria bacterium]|nr:hypothetical protein [Deltaproteobacteria bacterium]
MKVKKNFTLTVTDDPAAIESRLDAERIPPHFRAARAKRDALVEILARPEPGLYWALAAGATGVPREEAYLFFSEISTGFFEGESGGRLLWSRPSGGGAGHSTGLWGSSLKGFAAPAADGTDAPKYANALEGRYRAFLAEHGLFPLNPAPKPPARDLFRYYELSAPDGPSLAEAQAEGISRFLEPQAYGELRERLIVGEAEGVRLAMDYARKSRALEGRAARAEALRAAADPLRDPEPARVLEELYGAMPVYGPRAAPLGTPEPSGPGVPFGPGLLFEQPCGNGTFGSAAPGGPGGAFDPDGACDPWGTRDHSAPGSSGGPFAGGEPRRPFPPAYPEQEGLPEAWKLPGGREILVRGREWSEPADGSGGQGALSLVRALSGHASWGDALSEIAGAYGAAAAAKALAFGSAASAKKALELASAQPPSPPEACGLSWRSARGFLAEAADVPEGFLDALLGSGLVASDRRGAVMFMCEGSSGAFRMRFPGAADPLQVRHPRSAAGPFVLDGPGEACVVADSPVSALRIKFREPDSLVLVLGENSDPMPLLGLLAGRSVRAEGRQRSRSLMRVKAFLRMEGIAFRKVKPDGGAGGSRRAAPKGGAGAPPAAHLKGSRKGAHGPGQGGAAGARSVAAAGRTGASGEEG